MVLAPLFVIAWKPKIIMPVLIAYFLFTSGFVFEVSKQPNVEQLTIPYNVGLSSHRLDLGASITEDDWEVRRYVQEHQLYPIAADIVGADFIGEVVGWRDDLHIALRREPTEIYGIYVFIRSENTKTNMFTVWNGVGCRKYVDPIEYYGIDPNTVEVIYTTGNPYPSGVIWLPAL